jgi:hypothetical protein
MDLVRTALKQGDYLCAMQSRRLTACLRDLFLVQFQQDSHRLKQGTETYSSKLSQVFAGKVTLFN